MPTGQTQEILEIPSDTAKIEPKEPKEKKETKVLVIKGKRGRKPKVNLEVDSEVKPILVEINEIINYPLS